LGLREDFGTGMHKKLPGARILPDMKYHGALAHHGNRRYPPPPHRNDSSTIMAGTWQLLA
jgi:hypothetical protein